MDCYCGESHDLGVDRAIDELSRGPGRLAAATKGLPRARLDRAPEPGRWSVREIVAHLRDAELITAVRYRLMLVEQVPNLPPMEQGDWADRFQYRHESIRTAIAAFRRLREDNVALLRQTTAADREHEAWHPRHGTITLKALIVHMAAHDRKHLDQIKAARKRK